jgi:anoctamin-10
MSIICLQLPFELAYAHIFEIITSDIIKYVLTAIYLLIIQYLTRLGGKVSVKLINREINESVEYRANSLIYKVRKALFCRVTVSLF